MTKKFDFNWRIPVPESLLAGCSFDKWTEVSRKCPTDAIKNRQNRPVVRDSPVLVTRLIFSARLPVLAVGRWLGWADLFVCPCKWTRIVRSFKAAPGEPFKWPRVVKSSFGASVLASTDARDGRWFAVLIFLAVEVGDDPACRQLEPLALSRLVGSSTPQTDQLQPSQLSSSPIRASLLSVARAVSSKRNQHAIIERCVTHNFQSHFLYFFLSGKPTADSEPVNWKDRKQDNGRSLHHVEMLNLKCVPFVPRKRHDFMAIQLAIHTRYHVVFDKHTTGQIDANRSNESTITMRGWNSLEH